MAKLNLRTVVQSSLIALTALISASAFAQAAFPSKPINVIVPFPAGGSTDNTARAVMAALSRQLGQNIVIENVSGASGVVGMNKLIRSPADGYTLGIGTIGTHVIVPALSKKAPYDAVANFEPIGMIGSAPMTVITKPGIPAKNLTEFAKYLQTNKDKVSYGSAGVGSMAHYGCVMFLSALKVDVTHVPYRGTAPAITDLMGGQIDFVCDQPTATLGHIKGGKVKGLVVLGNQKLPQMPELPTAASQGFRETDVRVWTGLFAPKGTPPAIINRINEALQKAYEDTQLKQQAREMALDLPSQFSASPGALSAMIVIGARKDAPLLQARKEYLD
jgi:tripartite-type tricarboxylate transporter receptor subunit TctC